MNCKNVIFLLCLLTNKIVFSTMYKITPPNFSIGFFSVFNTVLGALDFFEKSPECTGLILDFEYPIYCYGQNWWSQYFEPIKLGQIEGEAKKFRTYEKVIFNLFAQFKMSRERGNELINKYVIIKPHIQNKIDAFVNEHFEGNYVIGIHYRGTDKYSEAATVTYEEVLDCIKNEVAQSDGKNIKIFVATDEEPFLHYMHKNLPGKVVAIDAIRSHNGTPVHNSSQNGYKKGEDALIDCILLSKCSKLYKMASNLSDVSIRFNPLLPVVHITTAFYEKINRPTNSLVALNAVLSLLNHYEENSNDGFSIGLHMNSFPWWEDFFMPLSIGNNNPPLELTLYDTEILGYKNMFEMPPVRAHELIEKYIALQPNISEKIDTITQNFKNNYIIGIYYSRLPHEGTASYNDLMMHLIKVAEKAPNNYKIVLITNDAQLATILNANLPNIINPIEPNLVASNEILNSFLLSKSNVVIGTGSFCLNAIQQFNPTISVIELNEFYLHMN